MFNELRYLKATEHAARNRPAPWADVGGKAFRGGQVRAINGSTVEIKMFLEPNIIDLRTCSSSLFQGHSPVVGSPVCCEVDQAAGHAILAVFSAAPADHAAERAFERDGISFNPGRVMPAQGGNPEFGGR